MRRQLCETYGLGTRMWRGGADSDGYVANFVESEQITGMGDQSQPGSLHASSQDAMPSREKPSEDQAWYATRSSDKEISESGSPVFLRDLNRLQTQQGVAEEVRYTWREVEAHWHEWFEWQRSLQAQRAVKKASAGAIQFATVLPVRDPVVTVYTAAVKAVSKADMQQRFAASVREIR